jgi:hypothetical protein
MNTAKKVYESDAGGVVHVDVPVGKPGQRIEVLVVWHELAEPAVEAGEDWSDLYGLLRDDPLSRPDQGQLEVRDELA